jgi:hypothetical protein
MLCYVMLRYVTLRYVTLRYVALYCAVLWCVMLYYIICSLFYDAFSVTKTIYNRVKGWYVIDELAGIWKDAILA